MTTGIPPLRGAGVHGVGLCQPRRVGLNCCDPVCRTFSSSFGNGPPAAGTCSRILIGKMQNLYELYTTFREKDKRNSRFLRSTLKRGGIMPSGGVVAAGSNSLMPHGLAPPHPAEERWWV